MSFPLRFGGSSFPSRTCFTVALEAAIRLAEFLLKTSLVTNPKKPPGIFTCSGILPADLFD